MRYKEHQSVKMRFLTKLICLLLGEEINKLLLESKSCSIRILSFQCKKKNFVKSMSTFKELTNNDSGIIRILNSSVTRLDSLKKIHEVLKIDISLSTLKRFIHKYKYNWYENHKKEEVHDIKICEFCGKENDGSYGSGRFCCQRCSVSYSSSINKDRKNKKISLSLRKFNKDKSRSISNLGIENKNLKKVKVKDVKDRITIIKCPLCGGEVSKCICKEIGGSSYEEKKRFLRVVVKHLIRYFNFNESKLSTPEFVDEYLSIYNKFYKEYVVDRLPIKLLVNTYNGYRYITRIAGFMGIPTRDKSETQKIILLNTGRLNIDSKYYRKRNQFKSEYHNSWDDKIFYLRSSYEIDYASYLDNNKILYEVESKRIEYYDSIKRKVRIAIPDFYLVEENILVEVKSSYTFNKVNMIDKFSKYMELGYKVLLMYEHKSYTFEEMMLSL